MCLRETRGSSSSRKTLEPPWDFPQPLEAVAVDEDGEDEFEESARLKQIIESHEAYGSASAAV